MARGVQIYPGGFTENSRGVHIFRFVSINTTLAKPSSFQYENWRVCHLCLLDCFQIENSR